MNSPGMPRTILWIAMILYLIGFGIYYFKATLVKQRLSRGWSFVIGLFGFVVSSHLSDL